MEGFIKIFGVKKECDYFGILHIPTKVVYTFLGEAPEKCCLISESVK